MAATSEVTVYSALWTLLSSSLNGTIENQTGSDMKLHFASSLPAASTTAGHVLESTESVPYNIDSGNVYGRIISTAVVSGPVAVTV